VAVDLYTVMAHTLHKGTYCADGADDADVLRMAASMRSVVKPLLLASYFLSSAHDIALSLAPWQAEPGSAQPTSPPSLHQIVAQAESSTGRQVDVLVFSPGHTYETQVGTSQDAVSPIPYIR
jgi:hypothetical protein